MAGGNGNDFINANDLGLFFPAVVEIKPSTEMQVTTRSAGEMETIQSMAAQAMIIYGREMGKI